MSNPDEMPDFSEPAHEVIQFRIDGDVFEAFATVAAKSILDVSEMSVTLPPEDATMEEQLEAAKSLREHNRKCFKFVQDALLPSSQDRFAERLTSNSEPITMGQVTAVYRFLMQRYSGRPTTPPSSSSDGPGGTGTSSMDTARIVDLTPTDSSLPGSLT